MLGRRSHSRFAINPSPNGLLRIVNDVVVQQSEADGLVAVSREPGIVGESLAVQVMTRQGVMHTSVRVTESRPLVTDGNLRHRLQLESDQPARTAV